MYATLSTGRVNRTLTTADLSVADSDTDGACGLHAAMIPISAATVPASDSPNTPVRVSDAFFALLADPQSARTGVLSALFTNVVKDVLFAIPSGFETKRPDPGLTPMCATPILAPGSASADDGSLGIASICSDTLGEGSQALLVPMAPPWVRQDEALDMIPPDGTVVKES
jgi:hypothetical protein